MDEGGSKTLHANGLYIMVLEIYFQDKDEEEEEEDEEEEEEEEEDEE